LKKGSSPLLFSYFIVAALHLAAIFLGGNFQVVVWITKPLLLLILLFYFYYASKGVRSFAGNLVLLALFFSWIGDIILMFQEVNANFFIGGLVSFLVAHLCYIFAFRNVSEDTSASLLSHRPWLVLVFIAYGIAVFLLVRPGLGSMLVPVILYEVIILLMGITALNRFGRVDDRSFLLVFGGAILFMLSDSLLAINKFFTPFLLADFLIMLTYITAQYCIVKGMVAQLEEVK